MPKFQNERLQRAAEEAKATIEERVKRLDQISADIKQLEQYLQESTVRERIEHRFAGGGYGVGDPAIDSENGGGTAEEIIEYLVWEKLANQDRWRIMYVKTHREGFWDEVIPNQFYFDGEPKTIEHRPLIEAPVEVRLRAGEALPELLAALATNGRVSQLP